MPGPGDVVVCDFMGDQGVKRRPAVIVSTDVLHASGADVVAAELTTQLAKAGQPTSYALQDWSAAGLHQPSVFRCYFSMVRRAECWKIGHLSDRDWREAQARLRAGLAVT
jgi:mRNA interferase MazF